MPFPANAEQLWVQGYKFAGHGECQGCHDQIEWWRTPQGRHLPMNRMRESTSPAIAHWATCPESGWFRQPQQQQKPVSVHAANPAPKAQMAAPHPSDKDPSPVAPAPQVAQVLMKKAS